jgi:LPS-assembly protein
LVADFLAKKCFSGWQLVELTAKKLLLLKRTGYSLILVLLSVAVVQAQVAAQSATSSDPRASQQPIEISADGENRYQGGIAYAQGNVTVRYGEDIIDADQITYDKATRLITATGNVRIYAEKRIYRGEYFTYDLDSKKVTSRDFKAAWHQIYAVGQSIESPATNAYLIKNGTYTIDNRERPSYSMKARTMTIYPDDRIVCHNVTVYIEDVPVMWLPYVAMPINKDSDNFDIGGGSSSYWGIFATGAYTTALGADWQTTFKGAYYSRRGPGGGLDVEYQPQHNPNHDAARFSGYYVSDGDPAIGNEIEDRSIIHGTNRYRISYQQRYQLTNNLTTMADINVWSDRLVTEDFFPSLYRNEIQPDNYASANYYDDNFMATFLGRIQTNNLFNVTERKPEFTLDFKRQKFLGLPIHYEGQSSVVNFERAYDRDLNGIYQAYQTVRYDSFHQFSYPRQYFGWLALTPLAGVRGTYYMENNNPFNQHPDGGEGRVAFNAGLNASFKLSRTWLDFKNPDWGIDGLRHVLQPYVEAAYVLPVGMSPGDIRGYDAYIPSTRLQPLDRMLTGSIDSIDRVGAIKHGVSNRLQTKRDGLNYNLMDWNLYTQANLTHSTYEGMLTDSTYSQIYNDINFYPVPWLKFSFYSATAFAEEGFNEIVTGAQWQAHPALSVGLWYNHLDNVNYALDNVYYSRFRLPNANLITEETQWRLNENWSVGQRLSWEASIGRVQEQRYSLYRDLSAWIIGFTVGYIDNGPGGNEFLTYLSVTLKAYPRASIRGNL